MHNFHILKDFFSFPSKTMFLFPPIRTNACRHYARWCVDWMQDCIYIYSRYYNTTQQNKTTSTNKNKKSNRKPQKFLFRIKSKMSNIFIELHSLCSSILGEHDICRFCFIYAYILYIYFLLFLTMTYRTWCLHFYGDHLCGSFTIIATWVVGCLRLTFAK